MKKFHHFGRICSSSEHYINESIFGLPPCVTCALHQLMCCGHVKWTVLFLLKVELSSELGKYDRFGKGSAIRTGTQFSPNKLFDEQMTVEEDYLSTFSDDTLFSSLNQPFAFPDPREIC